MKTGVCTRSDPHAPDTAKKSKLLLPERRLSAPDVAQKR
jgi:hypothetical protein